MADPFRTSARHTSGKARIAARRLPCLLGALALLAGCSTRTLTIESEPPGAEVVLDRRSVGTTPVTVPFRYGGVREIILLPAATGSDTVYKPAVVYHDTSRFALDTPVIDGFADLFGADDHQTVRVTLEPSTAIRDYESDREAFLQALQARAEVLRQRARAHQLDAPPREPLGIEETEAGAPPPPAR